MTADKPAGADVKSARSVWPWTAASMVTGGAIVWGMHEQQIPAEAWKEGGYFVLIFLGSGTFVVACWKVGKFIAAKVEQLIALVAGLFDEVKEHLADTRDTLISLKDASEATASAVTEVSDQMKEHRCHYKA